MEPIELLNVFAESYLSTIVSAEFTVLSDSEEIWNLLKSWIYVNDLDDSKYIKNNNIIEFPTITSLADFSEYLYGRFSWIVEVKDVLPQSDKLSCWIYLH